MKRIDAIIRSERLADVALQLESRQLAGFTITDVRGHGSSVEKQGEWRGLSYELSVTHKLLVTLFIEDDELTAALDAISSGARTGQLGDGLIAVSEVTAMYRISPSDENQADE